MGKKKKKSWSTDRIVSLSAILISFITLVVFIYQTNLMAEQQRLSTMPYLTYSFSGTGTPNFTVFLANDGIGPAFVESMEISYQDSIYEMDLPGFLYSGRIPEMDSIKNVFHSNIMPGQLIPAGRKISVLEVDNSKQDGDRLHRLLLEMGIHAQLVYRSAYSERWRLSTNNQIPERLD
ncbi:MAG: hypothetical protein AAFO02_15925 [Bacteroidota bacterium]